MIIAVIPIAKGVNSGGVFMCVCVVIAEVLPRRDFTNSQSFNSVFLSMFIAPEVISYDPVSFATDMW